MPKSTNNSAPGRKRSKGKGGGKKEKVSRGLTPMKFVRTCSSGAYIGQVISLDEYDGFHYNSVVAGSYNMQLNFSLAGTNVYFGGVFFFTIAMPNYTEFTSLFDQYKIDLVEVMFIFSNNQSSVNQPATVLPLFISCLDYDDSNLAGFAAIEQYSNHQLWQAGSSFMNNGIHTVKVKPNPDFMLYNGATSGYGRALDAIMDTGSSTVPHYGVKVCWDTYKPPVVSTNIGYLNIVCKYHFSMYNSI
jgi:hypothetical protein